MTDKETVLITGAGAGGEVGAVSPVIVESMIAQGFPVRAFVRRDDDRAESLRKAGADVFVGDLLDIADVSAALAGCRRVYFSMSLSPYYSDAVALMAAAARAQGNIEVLVNISEFEQSFMTFDVMTAPLTDRLQRLGGHVTQWSPQQRAHWVAEQVLAWSGLPVVNVQATIFVENPILSLFPLESILRAGELRLPFGARRLSPIAGYDVADVCAGILADPSAHIGRSYVLTGPQLIDMDGLAEDYSELAGRPVVYVPEDVDDWIDTNVRQPLSDHNPHVAAHLATLVRMVADGLYEVVTDDLEILLQRPAKTVRWALRRLDPLRQRNR